MKNDNNIRKIPELLAPAGSPDALYAAVQGGADAVYFGGKTANARNSAKNFTDNEVSSAIEFLHDNGKSAYITLNTLHTDKEIKESQILSFAEHCCKSGADAFILQDIGLSQIIRRYFPEIKLHASTQMSGHNLDSSKQFSELGFSRMVIARELDFENLQSIIINSPIEIEMFVHGALCSSHSGRCFMSFAFGNTRSANRGMCAQPCRMQYNGGYMLSLKDLCLANHLEEIIKLAPASLKIEGRMKPPEYVYNICKIYRTCLDESRDALKQEIDFLSKIFSRQGFTNGYFTRKLGVRMYGVRTEENKRESKDYGISPEIIRKDFQSVNQSRNVNLQIRESVPVNQLIPHMSNIKINPKLCLIFNSYEQYAKVADFLKSDGIINRIYRIFTPFTLELSTATGVRLPYVIFDNEKKQVIDLLRNADVKSVLIDNIGHIDMCREANPDIELFGDFGLNITNSRSLDEYKKMGFSALTLSPELNFAQIRDINKTINSGIVAYGKTHIMISENCVIKNNSACKINYDDNFCGFKNNFYLTDKTGAKFLICGDFGHRNIIYNSVPIYLADKKNLYKNLGLFFITLNFTDETPSQIKKIVEDYAYNKDNINPPEKFSRGYK